MSAIDDLNPYDGFRTGQRESIQDIVRHALAGDHIIEYKGPTGCGKSLVLSIVARALADEGFSKTIYTTPQKSLVHQLANDKGLGIIALLGRANYPCPKVESNSAADCPVPAKKRRQTCPNCPYQFAKEVFLQSPLGATTLDKMLVDRSIPTPDIMVIDESQGLEMKLIEQRSVVLPEQIELNRLEPSLADWVETIEMEKMKYETKLERTFSKIRPAGVTDEVAAFMGFVDMSEATKAAKRLTQIERILSRAKTVLRIAQEAPGSFIVDSKTRAFKLLSGREEFRRLVDGIKLVILASGTPCTQLLADGYSKIEAPHPIDVDRRRVYYMPCGKMNYQERDKTIDIMAETIADLHKKYNRNTLVHCHSFVIAEKLGHAIYDYDVRCRWIDRKDREGSIKTWQEMDDTCLLSVACEEGLDLPGEKYPLNIIAKVPFLPYKSDEWTDKRKALDNSLPPEQRWENVSVALSIQQACGRCTRGPSDWSETYILDASFEWFYRRNFSLFETWFRDALMKKVASG